MKITYQELISMNPPDCTLEFFNGNTNGVQDPVDISKLVAGLKIYGHLLFIAGKMIPKERIAKFACDCAKINALLLDNKPVFDDKNKLVTSYNNLTKYSYARASLTASDRAKTARTSMRAAWEAVDAAFFAALVDNNVVTVNNLLIEMFNEFD